MSSKRHTGTSARLVLTALACAAAATALTSCGGGTTDRASVDSGRTTAASDSPSASGTTATSGTPAQPSEAATVSASSAAPSSPAGEPRMIAYAGGESAGVEVHGPADADKLDGAPESFKTFIGSTAEKVADEATCSGADVGVTVEFLRTDGYAAGGVNECGGYAALWAVVDGTWTEIQGTQEIWSCAILERYQVPSDVAGESCYDYDAQKERTYHQA